VNVAVAVVLAVPHQDHAVVPGDFDAVAAPGSDAEPSELADEDG